jgi:outer membrane lipoprotein
LKGKLVILGGTIARTENTNKGAVIEVIQRPLDYWGKPKRTDRTGGRFLVLFPGNLNALVYGPGRDLTVAAEVEGTRGSAPGEEADYSYPVVAARELKLWERERESWDRPQWIDPLYDPFSTGGRGW